jgi:peptide deformylase
MNTPLLKFPNPMLLQRALPCDPKDGQQVHIDVFKLMWDVMLHHKGLGLAAPQIGIPKRMIVGRHQKWNLWAINPEVEPAGKDMVWSEEGCLSVPGRRVRVRRYKRVHFTYWDQNGKWHDVTLGSIPSLIVQHETDHLDGITLANFKPYGERLCVKPNPLTTSSSEAASA